jgi:hypothetical protein
MIPWLHLCMICRPYRFCTCLRSYLQLALYIWYMHVQCAVLNPCWTEVAVGSSAHTFVSRRYDASFHACTVQCRHRLDTPRAGFDFLFFFAGVGFLDFLFFFACVGFLALPVTAFPRAGKFLAKHARTHADTPILGSGLGSGLQCPECAGSKQVAVLSPHCRKDLRDQATCPFFFPVSGMVSQSVLD